MEQDMKFHYQFVENIRKDFYELLNIMKHVNDAEDARVVQRKLNTIIEIGANGNPGYDCNDKSFDSVSPDEINWFRVEEYGDMMYIYFYRNNGVIDVVFDIWDDDGDVCILESVTIDDIY